MPVSQEPVLRLVQIAQRAEDLARAAAFYTDALGPAGTDEWQAFVRDSEGNLVGLVEQRPRH